MPKNKNTVNNKNISSNKNNAVKNAAANKNNNTSAKNTSDNSSKKNKGNVPIILLAVGTARMLVTIILTIVTAIIFNPYKWSEHKFLWIAMMIMFFIAIFSATDFLYGIFAFILKKTAGINSNPITLILPIVNAVAVIPIMFLGFQEPVIGLVVGIVFELVIQSFSSYFASKDFNMT